MSNILIICSSPRKGGNSDTLSDEFARGAIESGNQVTKIRLSEKHIEYCNGCLSCDKGKVCPINDDMKDILPLLEAAEYIVFATPVYFYCVNGQMKTFLDRCLPIYQKLSDKKFIILVTAQDTAKDTFDETLSCFNGFFRCLNNPDIFKVIRGYGVYGPREIRNSQKALEMAYFAGLDC